MYVCHNIFWRKATLLFHTFLRTLWIFFNTYLHVNVIHMIFRLQDTDTQAGTCTPIIPCCNATMARSGSAGNIRELESHWFPFEQQTEQICLNCSNVPSSSQSASSGGLWLHCITVHVNVKHAAAGKQHGALPTFPE